MLLQRSIFFVRRHTSCESYGLKIKTINFSTRRVSNLEVPLTYLPYAYQRSSAGSLKEIKSIVIPRPATTNWGKPFPPRRNYLHNLYYAELHCNRLVLILQHNNLTVAEQVELRNALGRLEAKLLYIRLGIFRAILKLSVTFINLKPLITGPTCIITCSTIDENPTLLADLLSVINKNKKLLLLGGKLDSNLLNFEGIERASRLPALHHLQKELVGVMSSPAMKMVRLLSQNPQNLLKALETHKNNLDNKSK
ncbi:hypothetical protein G9A89_020928 [Geosiphon pyriformis]|nr:hypothetical protein G9A89_020928 [Geosiphon pyriformis]